MLAYNVTVDPLLVRTKKLFSAPITVFVPSLKKYDFHTPPLANVKIASLEPLMVIFPLPDVFNNADVVPTATFPFPSIRILSAGAFADPVVANVISP